MPFAGEWKDLGTWNTLTDGLSEHTIGNVVMDDESGNTHVINELELPIMCIGARNLVIAASNDGILISDKGKSENIKTYADRLQRRPMFEERRWGEYKVVDTAEFPDGYKSLTKQLKSNPVSVSAIRYTAIAMKYGRSSMARGNWYSTVSCQLSAEVIRL